MSRLKLPDRLIRNEMTFGDRDPLAPKKLTENGGWIYTITAHGVSRPIDEVRDWCFANGLVIVTSSDGDVFIDGNAEKLVEARFKLGF